MALCRSKNCGPILVARASRRRLKCSCLRSGRPLFGRALFSRVQPRWIGHALAVRNCPLRSEMHGTEWPLRKAQTTSGAPVAANFFMSTLFQVCLRKGSHPKGRSGLVLPSAPTRITDFSRVISPITVTGTCPNLRGSRPEHFFGTVKSNS
jgi:hypothetical protein